MNQDHFTLYRRPFCAQAVFIQSWLSLLELPLVIEHQERDTPPFPTIYGRFPVLKAPHSFLPSFMQERKRGEVLFEDFRAIARAIGDDIETHVAHASSRLPTTYPLRSILLDIVETLYQEVLPFLFIPFELRELREDNSATRRRSQINALTNNDPLLYAAKANLILQKIKKGEHASHPFLAYPLNALNEALAYFEASLNRVSDAG